MPSSETLTSLAMLKVSIDQGRDYLDYLNPFVTHILSKQKPDPVTDEGVCDLLRAEFGLEIPSRTVQIVLRRLARQLPLKRDTRVYRIVGEIPDPGVESEKARASRHIAAVVAGLRKFAEGRPIEFGSSDDDAINAICAFLSEFGISSLRAYLRGTAIPNISHRSDSQIVLVSEYVLHLQQNDPERFDSMLILVQGHMLANALLAPDLEAYSPTYDRVAFYLDTPLLIHRLGLEGELKMNAVNELVTLLKRLGGRVMVFDHTVSELQRVLTGAASSIESVNGWGRIVTEARRRKMTRSDILLMAENLRERIKDVQIEVAETPKYTAAYQIDEMLFEQALKDEVSYHNQRAKLDDINSVRSIYVLRTNTAPSSLENCKAVLVTNNSAFARAASDYGRNHEESREVSSVITDFSLANLAWLKSPLGAPSLPRAEVLAYAYAAFQPSKSLMDKYLVEIDKLLEQDNISERDHQLLRSSPVAYQELMSLTLGSEDALTKETITEALARTENEIRREEMLRTQAVLETHQRDRDELASSKATVERVKETVYWECQRQAKVVARVISGVLAILILVGVGSGYFATAEAPVLRLLIVISLEAV